MYRVTICNYKTDFGGSTELETPEEVQNYVDATISDVKLFKPEREIVENSEDYEESDILSSRVDGETGLTLVTLKRESVVDILDLSTDYDWLLQDCYKRRLAAYPDKAEYLDAKVKQASSNPVIREEGLAQEAAYCQACLQVKIDFPKPVRV